MHLDESRSKPERRRKRGNNMNEKGVSFRAACHGWQAVRRSNWRMGDNLRNERRRGNAGKISSPSAKTQTCQDAKRVPARPLPEQWGEILKWRG